MNLKHFFKAMICCCFVVLAVGCDDDDNNNNGNNLSSQDQSYMAMLAEANKAEIGAGELAATKGSEQAVRDFGQWMDTEHTMAWNSLDSLADIHNMQLMDTLSDHHEMVMQQLNAMSGHQFDSLYMHSQLTDHQTVMAMMQTIIDNADDQGLRSYCEKYLPHIQMHYNRADSIVNSWD